jgi:anti-sigma B factor antagonist
MRSSNPGATAAGSPRPPACRTPPLARDVLASQDRGSSRLACGAAPGRAAGGHHRPESHPTICAGVSKSRRRILVTLNDMNSRLHPTLWSGAPCSADAEADASGALVVRLHGELDSYTAPGVRNRLAEHLDRRPTVLLIDVTELEFLGVGGLSTLLNAQSEAVARRVRFHLTGRARPVVARMLNVVGWSAKYPAGPPAGGLGPDVDLADVVTIAHGDPSSPSSPGA